MAHRRLLLLLVVVPWMLVGAIGSGPSVSVSPDSGDAFATHGPVLTAPDSNSESPFAVSTEKARETASSHSGRSSRVRLSEGLLRRSTGIVSRRTTRIAKLRFMSYSRALAHANAGIPSWHSTTPPPLS